MEYELTALVLPNVDAFEQGGNAGDINALQQHLGEIQIKQSDIGVRIDQLRKQEARASETDKPRFEKLIADATHENVVAVVDLQMTERRLAALQAGTTAQPGHEPLIDRRFLEKAGTAWFLLMIPIVFALSRRIWVRSSPRLQSQVVDLESSPRLQRLEEAIESIAIEVERIGEAQRFATKLLTERPEPVVNRVAAAATPIVRQQPGTITPH